MKALLLIIGGSMIIATVIIILLIKRINKRRSEYYADYTIRSSYARYSKRNSRKKNDETTKQISNSPYGDCRNGCNAGDLGKNANVNQNDMTPCDYYDKIERHICPECGEELIQQDGHCLICLHCGFSVCNS